MGIANSAEIPHIGFLSPVAPSSPSALKPGTLRYQFGNIARAGRLGMRLQWPLPRILWERE
jgi:hypothetical protein